MNVAIVGYGVQGKSAAEYWHNLGNKITICDINADLQVPDWAYASLGESYLDDLDKFDLIVRSPAVHPKVLKKAAGADIYHKVTSTTNEFFKVCPTANIIGVTGTKGKGTTSSLIAAMLTAAGKRVHLGGNIGIDPLELLKNTITESDWVVLELANFQLIDIKSSPPIAVCLMVVPEHLDWHTDLTEYYTAKKQLFIHQSVADRCIYNSRNEVTESIVAVTNAQKVPYDVPPPPFNRPQSRIGCYVQHDEIYMNDILVCDTAEVLLFGRHNLENVCAAIAAVWDIIGGNTAAIIDALRSFKGLEHRIEHVAEVDGISFVNDSFATTPEATIAAIKAFSQPKVMILGGRGKGVSLDSVIHEVLTSNVRHVIAIGEMGKVISSELLKQHYRHVTTDAFDMPSIVASARSVAKKGDVVILSTACASFDMFANYKDRGNQFKEAVQIL